MVRTQESSPDTSGSNTCRRRILLVEDEAILAEMTRRLLLRWGYDVVAVVSSGESAVEQARATAPDLIVMDIRLSGSMDGFEAAQRISAERLTTILFTTGYSDETTEEALDETEGIYASLSKPIPPPALRAAVISLLDRAAENGEGAG